MKFGLSELDLFDLDLDTLKDWIVKGHKTKKPYGRPVDDAMLDRLAMGSLLELHGSK